MNACIVYVYIYTTALSHILYYTLTSIISGVAAHIEGGQGGVGRHAEPQLLQVLPCELVAYAGIGIVADTCEYSDTIANYIYIHT
mgnify:FL=1